MKNSQVVIKIVFRPNVFSNVFFLEKQKENKRLKSYLTMSYKYFHILYKTKKMALKKATITKS